MPNSETPMSQAAINAQNAFIAAVGTAFNQGDDALDDLITQLGGNVPSNDTTSGAAGVPTTGTLDTDLAGVPVVPTSPNAPATPTVPVLSVPSSWAWAPSPASPIMLPGGGAGYRAPKGEQWQGNRRRYTNRSGARSTNPGYSNAAPAGCPTIIPLVTTIPVPTVVPASPAPSAPGCPTIIPLVTTIPVPTVVPASPAPSAPSAPSTPPAVSSAPAAPLPDCRTGNYCLDIMNGCVLPSQVSPQQLQICSQAGYAGNRSLFPAIAAAGGAGGGAYFGTPEPNPPPYTGSGMSGLGQDDSAAVEAADAGVFSSAIESIITGVVAALALGVILKSKKFS